MLDELVQTKCLPNKPCAFNIFITINAYSYIYQTKWKLGGSAEKAAGKSCAYWWVTIK